MGDGRLDFAWLMQRRQWLDLAAIRPHALMEHLAQCTSQSIRWWSRCIAGVRCCGADDTVSDVLGAVGAGVYPGGNGDRFRDAQTLARRAPEGEWAAARLLLDSRRSRHIAGTLSQALLEATEHRRNIILFPDITPDYTLTDPGRLGKWLAVVQPASAFA
ncbi:hypothetical protein [Serratia marcescens]|uniref:hypothetical protein n=1 Tax=Serratia marcescens TaxID=615 RepID=UPI000B615184|nr:hypothetical protein [Serratia marcescens]ASM13597.1 hypothetical protein BVG93_17370 [Serratia marcescens]